MSPLLLGGVELCALVERNQELAFVPGLLCQSTFANPRTGASGGRFVADPFSQTAGLAAQVLGCPRYGK